MLTNIVSRCSTSDFSLIFGEHILFVGQLFSNGIYPWLQSQDGSRTCMLSDWPLVQHLPTSWQPVWRPDTFPACILGGLSLHLNHSDTMRSILRSHMMVTKNFQNVDKICLWPILMIFKIDLVVSEPHCVKLIFLWTSSIVKMFDIWHLFDILTSFWRLDTWHLT